MERKSALSAVLCGRTRYWGGLILVLGSCRSPQVDGVAVWLDGEPGPDGSSVLRLYDGGELRSQTILPGTGGTDTSRIAIAAGPGGMGFALSSSLRGTVWVNLDDGTRKEILATRWGTLGSTVSFARSGLGLFRPLADGSGGVWLSTADPQAQGVLLHKPTPRRAGAPFSLRSASSVQVVYWVELSDDERARPDGTIVALGFSDDRTSSEPIELGRTTLDGLRNPSADPSWIGTRWCNDGLCVSPNGDAAIALGPPCTVVRYRWGQVPGARLGTVTLPPACGDAVTADGIEPTLVAALNQDVLVLEDALRLYRADLRQRTWIATPKLGPGGQRVVLADGGRAAIMVSSDGAVTRIDGDDVRVVSAERTPCQHDAEPVVSPSGQWVVMSCASGESALLPGVATLANDRGAVIRISALGLERFEGIALRALMVDDGGSVLLYSHKAEDDNQVPRGLFVLDGEANLARVSDLEPTPLPRLGGIGGIRDGYFSAEARSWR